MEFLLSMRPEITGSHFGQHPVAFIISWIILLLLFVAITISVSIALSVGCVGLTFQMGSLEDRTHLISINERINNFENLKDI